MKISDFETGHEILDVGLTLSANEAEDLALFLERLLSSETLERVYLSDIAAGTIQQELTVKVLKDHEPAVAQCA